MKKEVSKIITVGLTTTMVLSPIAESSIIVNAQVLRSNQNNTLNSTTNTKDMNSQKQVYLSDIEYVSASVGWGEVRKDSNVEGNGAIKLIIDDETVEFGKGMGAHANSTLIYNISNYSNEYTRLTTYLGVDASRGSNGNGVIFTIYISENGNTWNEVKKTSVLKGDMPAEYVDINIQDAKFIKLVANNNGDASADHAVYGDLKLVRTDYTQSSSDITGLNNINHYDGILSSNSIEENINQNKELILKRAFVKRFGYQTLKRMAEENEIYSKGINYLVNNERALEYIIMGGPVNMHGSYQRSLKSFCEIYDKYSNIIDDAKDNYFNLRLAISIALSYSRTETVGSWLKSQKGVNPVHRFEVYQYLVTSGKMDEGGGNTNDHKQWSSSEFKALPIPMMRWSVDARMNDDEILWLVDYALEQKKLGNNYFDAYNYIEYTMGHNFDNPEYYKEENREKYNEKYNFEKYFSDYGTANQQRMWMAFEEGAVCGGLTQTYAVLADIFGRPSSPCGQPGHAAATTYEWNKTNQRYEWTIQNDISGWAESGNQFDDRMLGWGDDWKDSWSIWTNASYTVLAGDAVLKWEDYTKANLLVLLADSYTNNTDKIECYKKALVHQKINLDAWERIIECYKSDDSITSKQSLELAKGVIESYNYYPQAMVELLNYLAPKITDDNHIAQLDILKNNALLRAKQATPQQSTCVNMTKQMANWYLRDNTNSELATFSFDGDNSGKIVLNSKYEGSSIRARYSLDGGTTWKETNEHVISLTDEELASIKSENDIKVGLVGTDAIHTIDILDGDSIDTNNLYANDNENILIGKLENLEFSLDGAQTWCDYVSQKNTKNSDFEVDSEGCIRFNGNKTITVRYKAFGTRLKGTEFEFTFTQNTDTEDRKYVQLKNVSLVDCSTANSNNHKGEHFIDGTPNTAYHTTFNHFMQNKFYTVKFDKVRFINSVEYQPGGGNNGKLKSGKILTSLDGNTWTEACTFNNLNSNGSLKRIDLTNVTACKYLKIVATETYGNYSGEENMYFSGSMLNFYEDATKEYNETPTITYSNTNLTNQDVVATITLPVGCSIIGDLSYTFDKNATHTFKYRDINGIEQSIDAQVTWIDKESPTADVVYSTKTITNGDVAVSLENISEDATITNNSGLNYYTFTTNGTFEFELTDKAGNVTKIPVAVSWIDKEGPAVEVSYDKENKTNEDVTVTLIGLNPDEYVENNNGLDYYTFTENGTFEFIIKDVAGNTTIVPVAVSWIDKTAPTANIVYDINSWTSENVTARLTDISENVTILNDENTTLSRSGLDYHVFEDNGSYTFRFKDEAGNIGTATATVSWIDKTKPNTVTDFKTTTENGKQSIVASLKINPNEVEILNNDGKAEYTFTKNETFVFKLRLRSTGYEFEVPVTVDWLKENQSDNTGSTGGSDNSSDDSSSNNSNNDSSNNGTTEDNSSNSSNNGSSNNGATEDNSSNNSNNSSSNNGTNEDNSSDNLNNSSSNDLTNEYEDKPNTGDTIMTSLSLLAISLASIFVINRKKKK